MRVCILKNSGRIIEAQSNDDATFDSLIQNALAAGYKNSEIEVKVIPDNEFMTILGEQVEDGKSYAQKRAAAYPSLGDQLDALYKAGVFPAEMAAQIADVKMRYPKQ